MPRFFVEGTPSGEYFVGGENGRHIARSLRMRPGEELVLCDGAGTDYACWLSRLAEEGVWVTVQSASQSLGEPKTQVTVCQCLPKGDKLDTVTQKAVELGAAEIWPIVSSRCVVKLDEKAAAKKTARLQKIALEAAMQSGRGRVPRVLPPAGLEQALRRAASEGGILFFYEKGTASLRQCLGSMGSRVFLFVGPEGGFSPEEAALAQACGAELLSLGPRILRTETAPLAALSALFYEKGEMEAKGL